MSKWAYPPLNCMYIPKINRSTRPSHHKVSWFSWKFTGQLQSTDSKIDPCLQALNHFICITKVVCNFTKEVRIRIAKPKASCFQITDFPYWCTVTLKYFYIWPWYQVKFYKLLQKSTLTGFPPFLISFFSCQSTRTLVSDSSCLIRLDTAASNVSSSNCNVSSSSMPMPSLSSRCRTALWIEIGER